MVRLLLRVDPLLPFWLRLLLSAQWVLLLLRQPLLMGHSCVLRLCALHVDLLLSLLLHLSLQLLLLRLLLLRALQFLLLHLLALRQLVLLLLLLQLLHMLLLRLLQLQLVLCRLLLYPLQLLLCTPLLLLLPLLYRLSNRWWCNFARSNGLEGCGSHKLCCAS